VQNAEGGRRRSCFAGDREPGGTADDRHDSRTQTGSDRTRRPSSASHDDDREQGRDDDQQDSPVACHQDDRRAPRERRNGRVDGSAESMWRRRSRGAHRLRRSNTIDTLARAAVAS
jgi:hypothetical protein